MTTTMQKESTAYSYWGISGTVPSVSAEAAYLISGTRPVEDDWQPAVIIPNIAHPLWADAKKSGATGDYFVARLVGAYGGNSYVKDPGDWVSWLRLTGATEQHVIIAPEVFEVAG